jgi:hypothetical protein
VLLDLLRLHAPASYRMALFTIRAQFAAVDICVTFSAEMPDIRKHWLDVTLSAGHTLMESAQWIARRIVIKLWNSADWFPTFEGVAVLAGDI